MQSNTQALQVEPEVSDAREELVKRAQLPKVLNAAAITAFFEGEQAIKDEAKVAGAEKSRMKWLLGLMFERDGDTLKPIVGLDQVKSETAGYVKDKAQSIGWKGGKGAGKRPTVVKTAQARAAEIRSLYGAVRFTNWNPEGMGYKASVETARERLVEKGIKFDGTPIPDDETRKLTKIGNTQRARMEAAAQAGKVLAETLKRTLTPEEEAELFRNAGAEYEKQSTADLCDSIIKKHGVAVAEQVAAMMPQRIELHLAELTKAANAQAATK